MPNFLRWIILAALVSAPATAHPADTLQTLLAQVPEGAAWQDLPPALQAKFQARAFKTLEKSRAAWGLGGLARKELVLLDAPTPAMRENIDRVLGVVYASELPDGFKLARDAVHPEIKRALLRIYLRITAERSQMLLAHPEFQAWDGLPIGELYVQDHAYWEAIAAWLQETEARLGKIPDAALTQTERDLRDKTFMLTRAGKHFTRPALANAGSFNYPVLYNLPAMLRPFRDGRELLEAYNASMFAQLREVDTGTMDAFLADYESEFNPAWLADHGLPSDMAQAVLKLGALYRSRMLAHPDAGWRCSVFAEAQRAAIWDAFTASMMAHADDSLEHYAATFWAEAKRRGAEPQQGVGPVLDSLLPELTEDQRASVLARLAAQTRPAALLESVYAALDAVTGNGKASATLKAAVNAQSVGGYQDGEPLRAADEQTVLAMWENISRFLQREYRGYPVDIPSLMPVRPVISATERESYASGGVITIGLKKPWSKASLYSTLLHEIKHAIDFKTQAAVEGAAWEGAATSVERQVWPVFIQQAMASEPDKLPLARLLAAIDHLRLIATTDATLRRYLRPACGEGEPDSLDYAKQTLAAYGYTDPATLAARARRAHDGLQYLQYAYGLAQYEALIAYLQAAVGPATRVDAYLLQACAMPNSKQNQAAIQRLLACVRGRTP